MESNHESLSGFTMLHLAQQAMNMSQARMIDLEKMFFFRHSKLSYRASVGQCPRAPTAIGNAAGIEANVLESHVWKDGGPLLSINRGATRSDKTSTQRMQRGAPKCL